MIRRVIGWIFGEEHPEIEERAREQIEAQRLEAQKTRERVDRAIAAAFGDAETVALGRRQLRPPRVKRR